MDTNRPFHAYTDKGRFVCACCARRDAPQVYPVLRQLYLSGFNIWYDEGREPSDELTQSFNDSIYRCEAVLFFVSSASIVADADIAPMLSRAKGLRKPIIYAHIEGMNVPDGMETIYEGNEVISGSEKEVVKMLTAAIPGVCRSCDVRQPDDFSLSEEAQPEVTAAPLPTVAMTEEAPSGDAFEYTFAGNSGVTVVKYRGSDEDVVVEGIYAGHPVTRIGDHAFIGNTTMRRITLPQTLTFIGHTAFRECTALQEIAIPSGVTALGVGAFFGCTQLAGVTIPESVTAIGDYAFRGCSALSRLTIPDSVAVIGDDAFCDCMLLIIECTENSYAHWYATRNNIPFRVITPAEMLSRVLAGKGTKGDVDLPTLSSGAVSQLAGSLLAGGTADKTAVNNERAQIFNPVKAPLAAGAAASAVPTRTEDPTPAMPPSDLFAFVCFADEDYNSLKPIFSRLQEEGINLWRGENPTKSVKAYRAMESAMAKCRLIAVFLTDALTRCERAMKAEIECALKTRRLDILVIHLDKSPVPQSLASVDSDRFIERQGMAPRQFDIELLEAFTDAGCTTKKISKPIVTEEEKKALFTHPEFEYSVTTSGAVITKYKGSADKAEIPAKLFGYGVTAIGPHAFMDCTSLKSVTIPQSVQVIDSEAFKGCSNLVSVSIPSSVTKLGYGCFRDCVCLTDITIPSAVTEIGWHVFAGCRSLSVIAVPQHVNKIGSWAFDGCTSLTKVSIPDRVEKIDVNAFFNCSKKLTIVATKGSYAHQFASKNGYHWKRSN